MIGQRRAAAAPIETGHSTDPLERGPGLLGRSRHAGERPGGHRDHDSLVGARSERRSTLMAVRSRNALAQLPTGSETSEVAEAANHGF